MRVIPFRDWRIRRKLTLTTVLASAIVLSLAAMLIVLYDVADFRGSLVAKTSTQAHIVGLNCAAALIFEDKTAATETLSALRAETSVTAAAVFDARGNLFAEYRTPAFSGALALPAEADAERWHRLGWPHLELTRQIAADGDFVGTVMLIGDMTPLRDRVLRQLVILGGVLAIALVVAVPISAWLQRLVARPVTSLATTARQVSLERDYTLRASGGGRDEIGELVHAFNSMLEQIEQRDAALREANDLLEHRVAERTEHLRREISERRRAERDVRRLNEELEQRVRARTAELEAANRELEAFSYSVSHDLRAPLRSIDGFSQLLLEDHGEALNEEARSYLDRVRAASGRMGQLIDDLLSLARVSRSALQAADVDLSDAATAVIAELRAAQPERHVTTRIATGLHTHGDPVLLRLVLDNLIGNAWKYSSKTKGAVIEIGAQQEERATIFFVRDNGAGFDMAYADKLFGPFQRLHAAKDFDGTGIGLATVQRILERHGGRIWAEAAVGRGATFYFTLPEAIGDMESGPTT